MKIGLYFGSFNPVHAGHMIIANHLINFTDIDQVWMVVSPQSPFKKQSNLADEYDRLHLVELAIGDNPNIKSSNIEFQLPVPSYTIDTLTYLRELFPDESFSLIMGSDNIAGFHKWKNYEMILEHYDIFIYQRPGNVSEMYADHEGVHYLDAPLLDISSSFIRKLCKEGKSIRYLVVDNVYRYITDSSMYK
jgi:nicotinate-nucleotide adenylyltransferase